MTNKPRCVSLFIKIRFRLLKQILVSFMITNLFISFIAFGQTYKIIEGDTINRVDKNNLKQGKWKHFENSILESEGKYYDNSKEFAWISYFNNGKKKSIIEYSDNKPNGFCIFYYPSGGLKESGCSLNNKWIGNYDLYYPNGNHKCKYTFDKDGNRIGFNKQYYSNGIISQLDFCMDGSESIKIICDSIGKVKSLKSNLDFDAVSASLEMRELIKSENEIVFQKNKIIQQEIEAAKKTKELELANKEKEIKNSEIIHQKIINELYIKNKERELNQKNIEASNRQKQIKGLEHEKELSKENLKQQMFIRNLVLTGSGILILFLVFVFISLSKSKKTNKIIALQKTEVEEQKHLVDEKQKEIFDSISYAKRLQEAILPPKEFVNTHVANNFIYYQPKDIVAGDFYWAEKVGEKFFIAAADSTGHGVPGAMVSVVCSNALNRTIKEFKLTETGKILDKTRELVIETFEKSASEVKDGMDISLLCIDSKNKNIYWSGANNPLWYIQDNELKEIKADKQPIGKSDYPKPFTTHQIEYRENMTFYLFTDGLADQFGGPNGKKFKYKQFSDLLVKNNNLSQNQQAEIINKAFSDWKGDLEQVDDVCVIGIKL